MTPAAALIALGRLLKERGYRFTAITPASHQTVLDQEREASRALEDVFGWNRWVATDTLDAEIAQLLEQADALESKGALCRSKVRFATLGPLIFLHSGFPTVRADSVFFGPDTYRFVRALAANLDVLRDQPALRVVDIGCGSGAGGIALARMLDKPPALVLADINPLALRYSSINASLNEVSADVIHSDVLRAVEEEIDLVIANPPYLVDDTKRQYRDGGGVLGTGLSLRIVEEALVRLRKGGRLILYSGSPIRNGRDLLKEAAVPVLELHAAHYSYEEVDPDVFGEELQGPAYYGTDRLAAVVLTAKKKE